MGSMISDVFSSPNRGLTAYYALGIVGWAIGAAGTIRYLRHQFGVDVKVIALSVAGWCVGALVSVVLGLFWMFTWNLGFWGSPLGAALGGAIGGALTLPIRSLSSPAALVRASVRGAFSWGASFLVFQILVFYAGYILYMVTVNSLSQIVGPVWASVAVWSLPAGMGGFLAALLAAQLTLARRSSQQHDSSQAGCHPSLQFQAGLILS